MISLAAGAWECLLRPEVGGAIAVLRCNGTDVLRPMPDASMAPLESACFPLVPFCNRIAQAKFSFADSVVELSPNHLPEPHALHGLGWHRPWQVEAADAASAVLVHAHDGRSEWPWAYRAEQRLILDRNGLSIELVLINRDDRAMPAGLGLHPYFRRTAATRARFDAGALVEADTDLLPTGKRIPADSLAAWAAGTLLPNLTIDHCHADWTGMVRIEDAQGSIVMTASHAPHLHVYAPADGSALCFEPLSHTPDAPNRAPDELKLLVPGEAMSLAMRIEVQPQ